MVQLRVLTSAALTEEHRRHEAVLAAEADDRCHHAVASRAVEALALVEERRRHKAVLAVKADDRHRHKTAAQTAESEALTLVEECCRHEAATRALLSTVNPIANERSCHKAAARAPALAKLALVVRPSAHSRLCTGRRNIPRAPSSFVKVAPHTHPNLLPGVLPTPTLTMLARATSPCRSVVSSPTPALTTPHTPSLHPFTFIHGTLLSSGGGNALAAEDRQWATLAEAAKFTAIMALFRADMAELRVLTLAALVGSAHFVAWWCRHLHPPQQHLILPPSIPSHSMMELFFPLGEGMPIHSVYSVRKDFLFLHGSKHNASTTQIVLAGVISLALPINLLNGLRWGHGIVLVLPFGRFIPFPPPWYFSVDCWIQFFWIICLVVSLSLFVHLPLFFRFHFSSTT
jgi:hypothetical protein